jgi:hypothetical protein
MIPDGNDQISEPSDEFELLPADLPVLRSSSPPIASPFLASTLEDEFTQWQLNRFNRSGSISIRSILKSSFLCTVRHLIPLCLLFVIYFVVLATSFQLGLILVFVPFEAIADLVATSVTFSVITGERLHTRLHFLCSRQGVVAWSIQILRAFLLYHTLQAICARKSTATGRFFFLMLFRYMTYFQSCFVFEGLSLTFLSTCSFSLQLSFFAIPCVQSLGLFVSGIFCSIIAPLTFGFAGWTAYLMRGFVFLAVCGSGTNIANVPGI